MSPTLLCLWFCAIYKVLLFSIAEVFPKRGFNLLIDIEFIIINFVGVQVRRMIILVSVCANGFLLLLMIFATIKERSRLKNAWKTLYMLEGVIDTEISILQVFLSAKFEAKF